MLDNKDAHSIPSLTQRVASQRYPAIWCVPKDPKRSRRSFAYTRHSGKMHSRSPQCCPSGLGFLEGDASSGRGECHTTLTPAVHVATSCPYHGSPPTERSGAVLYSRRLHCFACERVPETPKEHVSANDLSFFLRTKRSIRLSWAITPPPPPPLCPPLPTITEDADSLPSGQVNVRLSSQNRWGYFGRPISKCPLVDSGPQDRRGG